MRALDLFTPATRAWFERSFAAPTPAQEAGWPAIASGEHTLIQAPTGSGKTLAAFLYGIDRLNESPGEGLRLLYVSPLKALNYDVERNLRGPLAGLESELTVAVRTGDTPQKERAAMLRKPPDILITTPESLFLLLTSQGREILGGVRTLILDEVHAVAGTKRGAHLALSVERLDRLVAEPVQRVGLSATQRPIEEIGRFVSGARPIRLVDAGTRKELDLQVVVPVEDMREPGAGAPQTDPLLGTGGEGVAATSIWPSIYPALLELVEEHRSTIVFVNNRRLAERLALRLNELAREGARPSAPRLARQGAAGRGRGAAQARRDPVPGRDLVAGARHRHGRRRPRHPGRVAEVGRPGPAAHRPRRTRAGRDLEGPDLPEVPGRPARVGRRRRADARRRDRGDASFRRTRSTSSPSRSSPLPPRRRSRSASCTTSSAAPIRLPSCRAPSSRTCSTCSPAGTRPTSSPS